MALGCVGATLWLLTDQREAADRTDLEAVSATASIALFLKTLEYMKGFEACGTTVFTVITIVSDMKVGRTAHGKTIT